MENQQTSTKVAVINVKGMGCSGCVDTVQKALESSDGVVSTTVDLDTGTATVSYHSDTLSMSDFKKIIEEAGYEFNGMQ